MKSFIRKSFPQLLFVFFSSLGPMHAFYQPPVNLSATTFMDGGAPPGFYYLNYVIFTEGRFAVDNDGKKIPGDARVNALVDLHQFYYQSTMKFLGANMALDVGFPLTAVTARGSLGAPLTANTAGLGDLFVGPALHWDGHTFLGAPVFHRFESDVTFPTGKYDKNQSANPSANLVSIDSFYSLVWLFHPKWETSWRLWYAVHGENDDHAFGKVRPGQLFHVNYAFSRAITQKWRLGVAGYYLQQTTRDRITTPGGMVSRPDAKERAFSAGPGFAYLGQGMAAFFSMPVEFGVRNRFKGSRATLQIVHRF